MSLSTEKPNEHGLNTSGFHQDLERLRQIPMLSGLEYGCLKLLAMLCRAIDFRAGEQLIAAGEDNDYAYFIISGRLAASYTADETDHVVREFNSGQFICGAALLGSEPALFGLQALEDTKVMALHREEFQKTMQKFPKGISEVAGNLVSDLVRWDRGMLAMQRKTGESDYSSVGVSLL